MYVYFRVADRDGVAVPRDDFRVSVSGSNEELEAFDRGYYLFSYTTSNTSHYPCKLLFQGEHLKPSEHQFDDAAWRARDAGVITAVRFEKKDKQEFAVKVVDAEGSPIVGASVSLRRYSGNPRSSSSESTDADGLAAFQAYPGRYTAQVNANGYRGTYKVASLEAGRDAEVTITLFTARTARLRVEWNGVSDQQPNSVSGEETVTLSNGAPQVMDRRSQWLGLVQIADRVALGYGNRMYGRRQSSSVESDWLLVLESEGKTPEEVFEAIDLDSLEEWKNGGKSLNKVAPLQYANDALDYYAVEPGDVVIGVATSIDPMNGRPLTRTFKAVVDKGE
ncbi:hypothetical protein Pla123a_14870 [Posidoniimonas polymericola]|uniref:Carboxypeptidase regulatory-like domain-containing protein n=1 Tax=Posidoniimonas polymericola TaxID=2528002 RepID=A0A5C5YRW5_9BACT|nr:carboxypeptidase-like regulatory domain-containing protein [Posidoniimonas polymericola]TWT77691.1 hypothetical protein Pla123a_14870 [Posidoniimonas polymericola]